MKVSDCMCCDVVCVKPETTVKDVAKKMQDTHVGCIPVCDEQNKIVGLVTDRDLTLRCIACDKDIKTTPVSDIMTTKVHTVCPEDTLDDAIKCMNECQVKRVPVIQDGYVKGMLTLGDLARDPQVSAECIGRTEQGICYGRGRKQQNQE